MMRTEKKVQKSNLITDKWKTHTRFLENKTQSNETMSESPVHTIPSGYRFKSHDRDVCRCQVANSSIPPRRRKQNYEWILF